MIRSAYLLVKPRIIYVSSVTVSRSVLLQTCREATTVPSHQHASIHHVKRISKEIAYEEC